MLSDCNYRFVTLDCWGEEALTIAKNHFDARSMGSGCFFVRAR